MVALSDPTRRRPGRLPLTAAAPRQLQPGPLELLIPQRTGVTAPSASLPPLPVRLSSLSQDTSSSVRLLDSGLGGPPAAHIFPQKTDSPGPQIGTLCADGPLQSCPG